jgi:putative ABC transport system permease protein
MSVFERTQEIGVLRALGWRRWRVLRMVMLESLALSLLGAAFGAGVGVALAELIRLEPTYGRSLVTPIYSWRLWGQTLLLALGLGALGGLYPAWRATALPPVEALRYE